jgi:hypothetical protein
MGTGEPAKDLGVFSPAYAARLDPLTPGRSLVWLKNRARLWLGWRKSHGRSLWPLSGTKPPAMLLLVSILTGSNPLGNQWNGLIDPWLPLASVRRLALSIIPPVKVAPLP